MLAEHLDRVLDEVLGAAPAVTAVPPATGRTSDTDPLDAPITEEFRVGTMTIAWDPSIDRIVIELFSNVDVEDDDEASSEPHRSRMPTRSKPTRCSWSRSPPSYARDFVARAQALVVGRPAALPVLPAADRPDRPHLPPGQRLPPRRCSS